MIYERRHQKDVLVDALNEVFAELKDNALDFVENTVFPYVDEAINDFEAAQTAEGRTVHIRVGENPCEAHQHRIDLVWSVTKKVVTKILEKAADDETAPAVQ